MLAAEAYLHVDDMHLRLYGVRVVEERKLGIALLFEGPLCVSSLAGLLAAVDIVARANMALPTAWTMLKNVAIGDGRVWKAFDYRGRQVPVEQRRDPTLSLSEIPLCRYEVHTPDFAIISYAYIEASPLSPLASQFVVLVECLQDLHVRGLVHGDIRASNVIFGRETATLIDFDFAGKAGVKLYPEGFVTDAAMLRDGARHRRARPLRPLEPEHDWYSLGAVMALFEPEDGSFRASWQKAATMFQAVHVNVVAALSNVKDLGKLQLRPQDKDFISGAATGSPPRKDGSPKE